MLTAFAVLLYKAMLVGMAVSITIAISYVVRRCSTIIFLLAGLCGALVSFPHPLANALDLVFG